MLFECGVSPMHGCFVRPVQGRVGLAARLALAWFALVLVAAARVIAEIRVPLPQILVEAEQAIAARQPGDAAELLDLVLSRVSAGEALPAGLALDRVRLAAATSHFQNGAYQRAQASAETLVAARPLPLFLGEGRMVLGLSLALQEKFAEAIPVFLALEESAVHRDKARLYRAMAAQQAGRMAEAIEAYSLLLASASRDADWADSALVLVSLHLQQKQWAEASRGLALLQGQRDLVDNLAGLNALCLQLGDALLAEGDADGALAAYRMASARDDLHRDQALRLAWMAKRINEAQGLLRGPAAELDAFRRMEARAARARKALEEMEQAKGYDAALHLRLGRAFLDSGAPWEAALAFDAVLESPAKVEGRPQAWFGLVRAFSESGRLGRAEQAWERFASALPGDPLLLQALFTLVQAAQAKGESALQLRLLERSEDLPGPDSLHEPLRLIHAQALLVGGRLEEARVRAEGHLRRFPEGRFVEDATYLHAMSGMLAGRQERAVREIAAYLKSYPAGRYEEDARYRLAAAHYGTEDYEEAVRLTRAWLGEYADDHPQRGEVLSLQADAWAGLGRIDAAVASYREAYALPLADELLGYVLDELTKHHQARREFGEAIALWEAFAGERPDHPYAINAAYWIGRLHVREGRPEHALERVAAIAARYLDDPTRDGVERLLGELAGLLARPPGAVNGAQRPPPTIAEASARLDALLSGPGRDHEGDRSPTARARLQFSIAGYAGMRGDVVAESAALEKVHAEVGIEALSPGLLGRMGDHLLATGRRIEARCYYERLVGIFGSSIFADFGYVGLGELDLAEGRPAAALVRFDEAIDRAGARFKEREAMLGRARALLALERWDEAREVYQSIAGNRQWRGEATAESVFSLGEILRRQGGRENLAQAQAHFQRVYLSYRKHTSWVALAYLRSAETFALLGQYAEAVATLREFFRDERLAVRSEAAEARGRLLLYEGQAKAESQGKGA